MADTREDTLGVFLVPQLGCTAELKEGSLKVFCNTCGQFITVRLPCDLGRLALKTRDFGNYHRWCSESALKPA